MKITTKSVLLAFPVSAALIWTAAAQPDSQSSDVDAGNAEQEAIVKRLDDRKAEILARVGIAAKLELPEDGEADYVAEALKDGLIVEATLEEVEAALEAAKATPEKEDDIEAVRLAQWGSYRFFLDGRLPRTNASDR